MTGSSSHLRSAFAVAAGVAALGAASFTAPGHSDPGRRWNGPIAFADQYGITLVRADGTGQIGIDRRGGDTSPAWSPDGSELVVATPSGLQLDNPDGTLLRPLTDDPGDAQPAWSPDGSRVAFINRGQIWTESADGTTRLRVSSDTTLWRWAPAWSPDGSRIAFQAYSDQGGTELWLLDLSTGAETRLTTNPANDTAAAWSPDGREIAFTSDRDGTQDIWTIHPDGTGEVRLNGNGYDPAWSPDGLQIAYLRNGDVWTMADDGSAQYQVTTNAGAWGSAPAWQSLGPPPAGCTIWGTDAPDLLVGTDGADVICGLGGDDTVFGLGGNDVLRGGAENDRLAGGPGRDTLIGGPGSDRLDARDGSPDTVRGGPGDTALVDGPADKTTGVRRPVTSHDIAIWRPILTSPTTGNQPGFLAVDGSTDDLWTSGAYPPAWIQIDLRHAADIGAIRLWAADNPVGSAFLVLGRGPGTGGVLKRLTVLSGPTARGEAITFAPKSAWEGIRYLRIVTPAANAPVSWASWSEIEVYPAGCGS